MGLLGIAQEDDEICCVFFANESTTSEFKTTETPLIQKAATQLSEYFNGSRKKFDLPLKFHGTEFQISVWKALQTIPFGETRSYKDIATMIGNPKACRAVGMANHNNPVAIIVPCHRVIGQNSKLTGYAGGISIKKALLDLETSLNDA